jgi:zinc transporter ZupT
VLAGFFFQIFLERYSEGIEHGHMHLHHKVKNNVVPIGIVLSLSIHSFTEGIPLGALIDNDKSFYSLLIGIIIHEIPASFALINNYEKFAFKYKTIAFCFVCLCNHVSNGGYQ